MRWTCFLAIVFVVGCGGGGGGDDGSDGGNGPGPSGPITVAGTVWTRSGAPAEAVLVVVEGHPPAITDAAGAFTVTEVEVPYDVTALDLAGRTATVVRGLTRGDPSLLLFPHETHDAKVAGRVRSPSGWPLPGSWRLAAQTGLPPAPGVGDTASPLNGAYELTPTWVGPAPHALRICAMAQTDVSGGPTVFHEFGTTDVTIDAGADLTDVDVSLRAVDSLTLGGTISASPGVALSSVLTRVRFGPGDDIGADGQGPPCSPFSLGAPAVPGTTCFVRVSGSTATGWIETCRQNLTSSVADLSLEIPYPPSLLEPPDDATGVVPETDFRFDPLPGSVNRVRFTLHTGDFATVHVLTAEEVVRLPDLAALGLVYPPSARFSWSVVSYAPLASTDEATGADRLWPAAPAVHHRGEAKRWYFWTAP